MYTIKGLMLFFVALGLTTVTYSQPEITVGKPYKVINGQGKFYFYKDHELLTVKKDDERLFIQKLNPENLSYLSVKESVVSQDGFEFIKLIKGKHFMFYSNRRGLIMREIDFKSGAFKDGPRQIISAKGVVGNSTVFGAYGIPERAPNKYRVFVSKDSSIVGIQYTFKPENVRDTENYEVVGVHIFDNNFTELASCVLKMPYTESRMNNLAYSVDAQGKVYIVTSVFENESPADATLYRLEILKVTPPGTEFVSTKVEMKGNFIKTIELFEGEDGSMTALGFYNKGKKPQNVDGIVRFKLAADTMSGFKTYEIPLSILNQYTNERTRNKNNKQEEGAELKNLLLRDIVFNKDGSMMLISEQFEKEIKYHSYYNGGFGGNYASASTAYTNGDLLVAKIDSSGSLSWMKKLPKGYTSGSIGTTFSYLPGKDEHHFLFRDKMKNFDLQVDEKHSASNGDILMAYTVNHETGKVKKTAILDIRNVKGMEVYQFTLNRIVAIAPSVFLFESYIGNDEDVLVKVDLSKL